MRWFLLIRYFLEDHFKKRFSLVCAFWGFPGGFLATLMAKVLFLPSMVNLQGGDAAGIPALNYGVMHRRRFRSLALWTYRKATVLTTLTLFQKNLLQEYGLLRTVRIIPFGADPAMFKVSSRRKIAGESFNVIHVSNYNPIKDPETLLKTFALIGNKKNAHLRIIGGEYEHSACRIFCRELGIETKVDFYGPVRYSMMREHYEWADMMLHTSLYEGQGIVIAEAAACGMLIAGTSVGLISDLGDAGAVVAPPGDFRMLAEKVLEILDNPAAREEKQRISVAWARKHDFFWTVDQYRQVFHDIGKR